MQVAVIGTFYGRHENTFPLLHRLLVDATRKPDEAWIVCESDEDVAVAEAAVADLIELDLLDGRPPSLRIEHVPTPREGNTYAVIPYSNKINHALDHSEADAFVYLDNNSMPAPEKYEVMVKALKRNPGVGAVYCTQKRTGFAPTVCEAREIVTDAYCVLNYTQVMHRRTDERWTLDMRHANPDLADGLFWKQLHADLGPFHTAGGRRVLDTHHIPHSGLNE